MSSLSAAAKLDRRIAAAVQAIPHGEITSYGALAERLGLVRGARRVARALAGNQDPELPWHRVLRAGGRIAFAEGSRQYNEQARRLRAEGHRVLGGRVRIADAESPSLDAAIWGRR